MGCDIHMVVERRWKGADGEEKWVGLHAMPWATIEVYGEASWRTWEGDTPTDHKRENVFASGHVHWLPRQRNYELFYALAQVRGYNDSEEGEEPRGVPHDASDLALMEIEGWGADGHSHSHMLFSEAMPIFLRYVFEGVKKKLATGKSNDELCLEITEYFGVEVREGYGDENDETLDDYRLIFWFDN